MLLLQYNTEKRTSVNNGYDIVPVLCNQNRIWNTGNYVGYFAETLVVFVHKGFPTV